MFGGGDVVAGERRGVYPEQADEAFRGGVLVDVSGAVAAVLPAGSVRHMLLPFLALQGMLAPVLRVGLPACVSANGQVKAFFGFRGGFAVYAGTHLFEMMAVQAAR